MDETRVQAATATDESAAPPESSLLAALKGSAALAGEATALAGALGTLAAAEASLSARASIAALGWRALAVLALLPAWILGVIAAVVALAAQFDSLAWACMAVAAAHVLVAVLALVRARVLAGRVGFTRTRTALAELAAAEPPP